MGRLSAIAVLASLLAPATPAGADVFLLLDGDRISGQIHIAGTKYIQVNTDFGRLRIPRSRIERILKDDGSEEVLNEPPEPPAPETVELALEITGNVFWHAWGGNDESDPTMRFEVRLDGTPVAVYDDDRTDPGEIRGATVNAFSFLPEDVLARPGDGVELKPAEVEAGRILLQLTLPGEWAGERALRVAYQLNEGTRADPEFHDVVRGASAIMLEPGETLTLTQDQNAGAMEWSGLFKKSMKNVGSFSIDLQPK